MPEPGARVRRMLDADRAGTAGRATPRLRLLDFDVEMRTPVEALTQHLTDLYAPFAIAGSAEHVLSLTPTGPVGAPHAWAVHLDAVRVVASPAPSVAFHYLLWEANRQAIECTTGRVLLHASAAVSDGIGILLPGPMNAGKSTIVAALVRDGFGYLTDEVVALDPTTGLIQPYPKSVSLGGALAHLVPRLPQALRRFVGDQRLVSPDALRPGAVGSAAAPRLVVAPRYEPGATATLEPLRPAEALSTLAQHAFHIERDPQRTLDVLATVVEKSSCFRLVSGDVAGATSAITTLVEELAPSTRHESAAS